MRFKGLKGLFTYHDFSPTSILSKEIIFDQLVSIFDSLDFEIYKYYLVREEKENPHIIIPYFEEKLKEKSSSQHFHIYFELKSKKNESHEIDTINSSLFDLTINNQKIHGNYISLRTFFGELKKTKALTFDFDNPSIKSKEILRKFVKNNYLRGSFGVIIYLLKEDIFPCSNLPFEIIELLRDLRKSFLSSEQLEKEKNNYLQSLTVFNFPSIKILSQEETIKKEKKEVFTSIVSSPCVEKVEPISVSLDCVDRPELFLESHLKEVLILEDFKVIEKVVASKTNLVTILLLNSFSKSSNDLITNLLKGSFVIENTKNLINNKLENKKGNCSILLFHNCDSSIDLWSILNNFLDSSTGENILNKNCKLLVLFDLNKFYFLPELKQNEIIIFIKKMKKITDFALNKKNSEFENELLLFLNALNCQSSPNIINLTITNNTNNIIIQKENNSDLIQEITSLQSNLNTVISDRNNLLVERDNLLGDRTDLLDERNNFIQEIKNLLTDKKNLILDKNNLFIDKKSLVDDKTNLLKYIDSLEKTVVELEKKKLETET